VAVGANGSVDVILFTGDDVEQVCGSPIVTGIVPPIVVTVIAPDGRGRSATNSSGTVTNYDSRGRGISRETTSGNTTTIYDAGGRNIGRFTTNR
jgi:hypothetical protein